MLLLFFCLIFLYLIGITVNKNNGVILYVIYISEHIIGCFNPFSSIGKILSILICHISPSIVNSTSDALIINSINTVLPIIVVPLLNMYIIAGRNDNDMIICGVFDRYCDDMKSIKLL